MEQSDDQLWMNCGGAQPRRAAPPGGGGRKMGGTLNGHACAALKRAAHQAYHQYQLCIKKNCLLTVFEWSNSPTW